MIKGIMQVDLNNELAVRYKDYALKSFEPVKDIFEIEVTQCVTPDNFLEELEGEKGVTQNLKTNKRLKARSPQEIGSLQSKYLLTKRLAAGEKFWIMEHDAYLRPQHENVFRMLMTKWQKFPCAGIGIANEFYTLWEDIAAIWIDLFLSGHPTGPMGITHAATNIWAEKTKYRGRDVYWPASRFIDPRWCNMTGLGQNCNIAHKDPQVIIHSPITQCIDYKYGGTVTDRPHQLVNGKYDKEKAYAIKDHPDFEWITLDND